MVTIDLSATVLEILTLKLAKTGSILFFAGGPDGPNDLKLISGVKRTALYHMQKNQTCERKKNFNFLVTLILTLKVIRGQRS